MRRWLWLSFAIVLIDQATKWAVLVTLQPYEIVPLLPYLELTLVFNEGAAFSFLADAGGWQRWLLAALALGIGGALILWVLRLRPGEHWLALSLALLIGGAFGNLIDRILFGAVVDFVQVWIPAIPIALFNPWPVFNVADSAISIGVTLLLILSLRPERTPAGRASGPS